MLYKGNKPWLKYITIKFINAIFYMSNEKYMTNVATYVVYTGANYLLGK